MSGARHTLFFLRMEYWGPICVVLAIVMPFTRDESEAAPTTPAPTKETSATPDLSQQALEATRNAIEGIPDIALDPQTRFVIISMEESKALPEGKRIVFDEGTKSLQIDQLDYVEFIGELEDRYKISIPDETAEVLSSMRLGDIFAWVEQQAKAAK